MVSSDRMCISPSSCSPFTRNSFAFAICPNKLQNVSWIYFQGKNKTRFYSIASAPAVAGPTASIELCIKEVPGGIVSPFVVGGEFVPPSSCDLILSAGHFVLPHPLKRVKRVLISGGVGIVAFISIIRSAADMCRAGVLREQISLVLLHSERTLSFPFREDLVALSNEFGGEQSSLFFFKLILCITRTSRGEVENFSRDNANIEANSERPTKDTIQSAIGSLSADKMRRTKTNRPARLLQKQESVSQQILNILPEVFMCGPGAFQKDIRRHLLLGCGFPKKLLHQEFFEL